MPSISEKELVLDETLIEEFDEIISDPDEQAERRRSRKPLYLVGAIILLSIVIGTAWWLYSRGFVSTDDAFIEGDITLISPKISAHVAKIYVQENQYVKKGDLLIELDPSESDTRLSQAKAAYQIALANLDRSKYNSTLTRMTSQAGLSQATSNLEAARGSVEQSRILSSLKQNAIQQARSQSATADATLKQAEAQVPAAQAAIEQAKAQVAAARNKLEVARIENERQQRLFKDGIVSRQAMELAGNSYSEAQAALVLAEKQVEIGQSRLSAAQRQVEAEAARLKEADANIAAAENDYRQSVTQINVAASQAGESAGRLQDAKAVPARIGVEESQAAAAQAEAERAEAAVRQAELELGYTKIYAPQDGYVSRKSVQEGQLVQPEKPLLAITQGGIWVVANFKETQLENIRPGQVVDIYVDAYPGTSFHGKVESFQAGTGSQFSLLPSENAGGNFVKVVQRVAVKIVFEEPPDGKTYLLVPGMSVVPKVHVR
jgi:membrane fusion protein (multidrug efflux system)